MNYFCKFEFLYWSILMQQEGIEQVYQFPSDVTSRFTLDW